MADISKVDLEDAERALLRAIYRENTIDKVALPIKTRQPMSGMYSAHSVFIPLLQHLLMPVSEHIKAAAKNNMVTLATPIHLAMQLVAL